MNDHEKLLLMCKQLKAGNKIISHEQQEKIDNEWDKLSKTSAIKRRIALEQKCKVATNVK